MQKPAHNCAFSHSASFASLYRLAFCEFMCRKKLGRGKVKKMNIPDKNCKFDFITQLFKNLEFSKY